MLTYFVSKLKIYHIRPLFYRERCLCLGRYFSSEETARSFGGLIYQPNFTTDEQKYILQRLNEADAEQLQRSGLPKNRIKKLDDWRKKNGKFNTLIEVLDVDGLGVKTLNKICKNILQGNDNVIVEVKEKPTKSRGQFLTPTMNNYHAKEINSSLGIHLYATGISWARIEKENNFLNDWNFFEFNLGTKKLSPTDALQLVIDVSKEIPRSDVYILEAPISVTPTAQQSPISVAAYVQRIQLLSMLITLLSTSPKHNPSYTQTKKDQQQNSENISESFDFSCEPKVFFLRHRLSARLFRTLIGTEKVSTATTVSNILQNNITEKIMYTPISVNENLCSLYNKQIPVTKEVLGQALLLTMAFMDVCIYQNPNSLKIVSSNSR